jgi:ferredoxin-NADP reductase
MNTWKKVKIISSKLISPDVKSIVVSFSNLPYKPGQCFDVRPLKHPSYRCYSIAGTTKDTLEFGIQLLPNGEISSQLFNLKAGDNFEIRGPLGNHFVLDSKTLGDTILIGGGSGVVPLISMLRLLTQKPAKTHIQMLISAKTNDHVLYKNEIDELTSKNQNIQATYILTRTNNLAQRIDKKMLSDLLAKHKIHQPTVYVAGPTHFVESMKIYLVQLGFLPQQIKTEPFGDS